MAESTQIIFYITLMALEMIFEIQECKFNLDQLLLHETIFFLEKYVEPNHVMDVIQSVLNVRKHLNIFYIPVVTEEMIFDIEVRKFKTQLDIFFTCNSNFCMQYLRIPIISLT